MPVGRDWGFLFGLALLGAVVGGVWIPSKGGAAGVIQEPVITFFLALLLPFSAEMLFRGVIHGLLAEKLAAQRARGSWFLSWPTMLSAVFYVAVSSLEMIPRSPDILAAVWFPPLDELLSLGLNLAGLLIFGLACGMARERSESLVAPVLFHWISVGLVAIWTFN
jgi:membrane protease YdiL (CAAX protease family)